MVRGSTWSKPMSHTICTSVIVTMIVIAVRKKLRIISLPSGKYADEIMILWWWVTMALQAAFAALAILIHQLNRFCPENIYDLPSQAFDDHSIFWPVRLGISSAMVPSEGIVDRCIIFMIFVLVSVHHPSRKILRQLPRHWACVFLSTQKKIALLRHVSSSVEDENAFHAFYA